MNGECGRDAPVGAKDAPPIRCTLPQFHAGDHKGELLDRNRRRVCRIRWSREADQ